MRLFLICLFLLGCVRPQAESIYEHVAGLRAKVENQITYVYVSQEGDSGGTGFHVKGPSGQTYLMTNKHICEDLDVVWVKAENAKRPIPRRVIEVDPAADLCLVEPLPGVQGLAVAKSAMQVAKHFHIFGHPHLQPLMHTDGYYMYDRDGFPGEPPSAFSTLQTYPGNSGSPVLNDAGEIVGVLQGGQTWPTFFRLSMIVQLEHVKNFLEQY